MLLGKGEIVLHGMINRLNDVDRSYGMEICFCCVES